MRAQLERTLSAKLDEMLNFKKAAYDKIGHGYNPSLSSSSTSSSALRDVIFVPPTTNVNSKITDSKNKIDS